MCGGEEGGVCRSGGVVEECWEWLSERGRKEGQRGGGGGGAREGGREEGMRRMSRKEREREGQRGVLVAFGESVVSARCLRVVYCGSCFAACSIYHTTFRHFLQPLFKKKRLVEGGGAGEGEGGTALDVVVWSAEVVSRFA